MYIVKPDVELWVPENVTQHIARVASICYGTKGRREYNEEKDSKMVLNLLNSGHNSVFRHYTLYYIVTYNDYKNNDDLYAKIIEIFNDTFVDIRYDEDSSSYLIAVNCNYTIDHPDFKEMFKLYQVEANTMYFYKEGRNMIRFTFAVTTQISTSRELNRVSPNNIMEESTRYCNYYKEKMGNDVTVCQPFWMDVFNSFNKLKKDSSTPITRVKYNGKNISALIDGKLVTIPFSEYHIKTLKEDKTEQNAKTFLGYLHKACVHYHNLLRYKFVPQEAREVLPLDTATFAVYTYSFDEWVKILLLRHYGVTGAPHPNAYIIATKIKNLLEKQCYNVDDRASELCKQIYNKDLTIGG